MGVSNDTIAEGERRLQWTARLGLAFLITACLGLASFQFGFTFISAERQEIVLTLHSTCEASIRPNVRVRSGGRLEMFVSQTTVSEPQFVDGERAFPDPLAAQCLDASLDLGDGAVPYDLDAPPDDFRRFLSISRSWRGVLEARANRSVQFGQTEDGRSQIDDFLEIELFQLDASKWGNPSELNVSVIWGWPSNKEDNVADLLTGERLALTNACGGCILEYGDTIVAPGASITRGADTALPLELGDIELDRDAFDVVLQKDGVYHARFMLRVDDPSRAAGKTAVTSLFFILIGAAFSLLTEAFLLTPLIRRGKA